MILVTEDDEGDTEGDFYDCDGWMELNAGKTKTMIVTRSRTMHPQSPPLTTGGTVLKESDHLDLLE